MATTSVEPRGEEPFSAGLLRVEEKTFSLSQPAVTALAMFGAGFVLRAVALSLAQTYIFHSTFGFGWETGRIARSIATSQGFSSPFDEATGPTAWIAPLYPTILAGIFKLFGVYSTTSGWVILLFNSVCSAFTGVVLYDIARGEWGERTGRIAGWTWALLPYAIYWPAKVVWETCQTAMILSIVFAIALRLRRSPSRRLWILFGIGWGTLALSNPVALTFAPPCLIILYLSRRSLAGPALAVGVALAIMSPWLVRNYLVFGEFVPVRSNFGEELRLGNGPGSTGAWMPWLHPTQNAVELQRFKAMGEVAYVHARGREALGFIAQNPDKFLANTVRRIYWFWGGNIRPEPVSLKQHAREAGYLISSLLAFSGLILLWKRRHPSALLFTTLFLAYPLTYYVTFALTRYRHPIEPEMILMIVYLVATYGPRHSPSLAEAA